ncbi:hypothetical protein [Mongoliitalea daihaiensis]|uniref:hypothetical protein n=1 Tax=Mongoliitalea daihaiensis TaxID=2782006 RepID=UPI001F3119F9|nr:hypothetical protein [Mongoliitalea daihaiensis]UJP64013.1 hypothetical protein IPZ59_14455 [Mongoliitalea daihaiensis]
MENIDAVLSHYMEFKPKQGTDKAKLIGDYYKHENHYEDPWFAKIISEEYQVKDGCDIFPNFKKRLVIYSAEDNLEYDSNAKKAKYPIHIVPDSAYGYYGMKLNILAFLTQANPDTIEVFYGENKSQAFRINLLYARVILEHYVMHYAQNEEAKEKMKFRYEQMRIENTL